MNKTKLAKRFKLQQKIGAGSFGEVYLGQELQTGEPVAIKLEKQKARAPQLLYESKVYKALQGGDGIPKLYYQGTDTGYNAMVISCLGTSLEGLFQKYDRNFTDITVLLLAEQMIQRMEYLHKKSFLHRDIKPDNFMMGNPQNGIDEERKVYVIDFGLSRRYRHPKTKQHIKYREGKGLIGTPRYASIHNHLGIEQSRRDDMEAIGYVLVYFCRSKLPWQGLKAKTKDQKYKKIMNKKMETRVEDLCEGCPKVLEKYLHYCRSLRFEDKPNYPYLRTLFKTEVRYLQRERKLTDDQVDFDWVLEKLKNKKAKDDDMKLREKKMTVPPNTRHKKNTVATRKTNKTSKSRRKRLGL